MLMRRSIVLVALSVGLTVSRGSSADEGNACNTAYETADARLKEGGDRLLDARDQLRLCAQPACKPWMVKECTQSLAAIESRIPTVVFSAADSGGKDVVDVTVSSGGRALASRLDGHAIEIGPGEKTFTFTRGDGAHVEVTAVVKEGQKAQPIAAVFAAATPAMRQDGTAPDPKTSHPFPLRTVGFAVGGAGLVGLAIGTVFWAKAVSAKKDLNCDENNECEPGPLADARSAASVATIGFIAGGVLLAGGVTLVLLAPSGKDRTAGLEVVPSFGRGEAGGLLRSHF